MPAFWHEKQTVSHLSISLPTSLLQQLDEMSNEKGYDNRSLAIADMIRDRLVEHRQKFGDEDIAGISTGRADADSSPIPARGGVGHGGGN